MARVSDNHSSVSTPFYPKREDANGPLLKLKHETFLSLSGKQHLVALDFTCFIIKWYSLPSSFGPVFIERKLNNFFKSRWRFIHSLLPFSPPDDLAKIAVQVQV